MYQILPLHWIFIAVVWITISVLALAGASVELLSLPLYFHYGILAVDLGLLLFTWKPVWIRLWHLVPGLNSWFPDLNGEYDVELRHNWPILQRLREAAIRGEKIDFTAEGTRQPDLGKTTLRATIDAGFYSVHVEMWSEDPEDPESVIDRSRTLVSLLKRPSDGQPHRLVYV